MEELLLDRYSLIWQILCEKNRTQIEARPQVNRVILELNTDLDNDIGNICGMVSVLAILLYAFSLAGGFF